MGLSVLKFTARYASKLSRSIGRSNERTIS